jgi:hypothetical protein
VEAGKVGGEKRWRRAPAIMRSHEVTTLSDRTTLTSCGSVFVLQRYLNASRCIANASTYIANASTRIVEKKSALAELTEGIAQKIAHQERSPKAQFIKRRSPNFQKRLRLKIAIILHKEI